MTDKMFRRLAAILCVCCMTCSFGMADEKGQKEKQSFVPGNDRERALFEMIKDLRAEVALLRRELDERKRDGVQRDPLREGDRRSMFDRDRPASRESENQRDNGKQRDGDRPRFSPESRDRAASISNPRLHQQAKKIFAAYDKNKDGYASFDEWLAMREGEMTDDRRRREHGFFQEPAGGDKRISFDEFYRWMEDRQSGKARRESGRKVGPRDRE